VDVATARPWRTDYSQRVALGLSALGANRIAAC